MHPRIRLFRRAFRHFPVLATWLFLFANTDAFSIGNPRLMVYLEVPGSAAATELTLQGLHLRGENGSVSLPVAADRLVAVDLAGKQSLLSSAQIPAGYYSSLHLDLSKIVGRIGVAEVFPGLPPGGVSIPVDLEIQADRTTTVFLRWRPVPIDPEAETHTPDLEVVTPVIPPLGSLAFATVKGCGSVVVIDRRSSRVVGAVRVDDDPRGLAYSRNNQTLFVALADQDAVAVVDAISLRLTMIVPLQFGDDPTRLLLSQDGATLYVVCPGSRTLTALSIWSQQQQFRLAVGETPRSVAQDPVSGSLFVACEGEGRIQIVDPTAGTITGSLTLLSAPVEVVIDPNSRLLFLGGSAQRNLRSFDLATESGTGDQNICGPVGGLAVNTRNRRLYASIPSCKNLAVIRPDIGIEFGSINLPSSPGLLSFDQEFRQLWVVLPDQGAVAVCNVNRGQLESLVEVDDHPFEVLVP